MNGEAAIRLKFLLFVYPIFWFVGLYPLWGGLVFISLIGASTNRVGNFFLVFGIVQLLSVGISVFGDWFQLDRLLSIFRNVLIYFTFVFAFLTVSKNRVDHWSGMFKWAVFINFTMCILISLYSKSSGAIAYSGLITDVNFSRIGYIFEGSSIRVSFMGSYANSAGILGCILFFIYYSLSMVSDESNWWLLAAYLASLISVVTSGSRIVIFVMLFFPLLIIFKAFFFRYLGIIMAPVLMVLFFNLGYFDVVNSFREGSSDTRGRLYQESLSLMMSNNIIMGLGIKPFNIASSLPLGSHSTYLGYLVKNGLLGFSFVIMYMLFLVRNIFKSIAIVSSDTAYIRWTMVVLVSIIFLFEDLDAFELNAVLFGVLLGLAYSTSKYKIQSRSIIR